MHLNIIRIYKNLEDYNKSFDVLVMSGTHPMWMILKYVLVYENRCDG